MTTLTNPNSNAKWVLDPFHFVAGGKALLLGLGLIAVAAVLCTLAGVHFDGIIDAHYGPSHSFPITLGEGLINFLLMSTLLVPFALAIGRPGLRLIDLFGTQALARAPFVLVALFMLIGNAFGMTAIGEKLLAGSSLAAQELAIMLVFSILPLIFSVWAIYLMYRSFAICTHTSGSKTIVSFAVALVLAELLSKVLYSQLAALLLTQ